MLLKCLKLAKLALNLIAVMSLAGILLTLTMTAFRGSTANDITPPVLIRWSITPTLLSVNIAPQLATVTVVFSDDISGLTDGKIGQYFVNTSYVKFTNNNQVKLIEIKPPGVYSGNLISGTKNYGVYQAVFKFHHINQGRWDIAFFGKDDASNSKHYNLYLEGFYSGTTPIYPDSIIITSQVKLEYLPIVF